MSGVIVVGAGLAGLAAAYELVQAGHDVTVLEARDRPGGRVHTLRQPFSGGLYAEAGAIAIGDVDRLTMKYCKLFDLPLDHIYPPGVPSRWHVRGRLIANPRSEDLEWPIDLTPEEQKLGLGGMWGKYVLSASGPLGDPMAPDWPPAIARKYDDFTFREFLRLQGASSAAAELLGTFWLTMGGGADIYSAFYVLSKMAHFQNSKETYSVRGGNDLLPRAFASRLGERIRYSAPVKTIERNTEGVRVVHRLGDTLRDVSGEYLISAIPFSALRHVKIVPPFSPGKQKAIEELRYVPMSRVFLQVKERFWLRETAWAQTVTDLPIAFVEDFTFHQPGEKGILESNTAEKDSTRIRAMKENERVRFSLREAERVFPEIRTRFELGASKCWEEDEWSGGAYACLQPGQMKSLFLHIARPEGRVHFAGEHTSPLFASIEGALESGVRAASELV